MIRVQITGHDGRKRDLYFNGAGSLEVVEAGTSQQWHGIRSSVRVNGGEWIEAMEGPEQIAAQIPPATGERGS
jgi:hypothetical protein